jgi:sulfotransferase
MFGFNASMNVYQRANQLTSTDGLLGCSYNNLREAFFGQHSEKLMLIDYETLCRTPEFVLQSIYTFCGLDFPPDNKMVSENGTEYKVSGSVHNFSNVEYSADEFDSQLGLPGLHTVSGPVKPFDPSRIPIIPPDIFSAHCENSFWTNNEARVRSNAIVL